MVYFYDGTVPKRRAGATGDDIIYSDFVKGEDGETLGTGEHELLTVTAVDPAGAARGATGDIEIAGTGFEAGLEVRIAGVTVVVDSLVGPEAGATGIVGTFEVAADAGTGAQDVVVENVFCNIGTLTDGFTIS